ncbi:Hypothetical protein A7982_02438 [Minicystis rosea]|nr:Hypothetical protein A7982_02438 [Minicystis rosea]
MRSFRVDEAISAPFSISLSARSELDDADLDALTGSDAVFSVGTSAALGDRVLHWTGICAHAELIHAEPTGLSTYSLTIVPHLWLLTQRTNCRVFRRMTAPEMAATVLREWGLTPEMRIDTSAYPVLDFRVQYNETDFSFVSRMLEESGVAYFFHTVDDRSEIVFSDRPQQEEQRGEPIPFLADPSTAAGNLYVTRLYRSTHVRPGAYRVRDYDFLHPSFDLHGDAQPRPPEQRLERYEYLPGTALALTSGAPASSGPQSVPLRATAEPTVLGRVAQRRLDAARVDRKVLSFETNVIDLALGMITAVAGHPRSDITADTRLLITQTSLEGAAAGEVRLIVKAAFASRVYRPALTTPRPFISGVQSATVVGPPHEEIHIDEHGRVRVLFPWDQEGARADGSSCWVRVSQAWAGAGFGVVAHPRVGDEVLVSFLDGDPDEPVVVGRLYNATHLHPYRLPAEKTRTGIRTRTSRGGGGHNEIVFEDRVGFESIRLHAHKDLIENVQRDHHTTVHRNRVDRVHGDTSSRIEGTRAESIGQSSLLAIEGDRTEMISGTSTTTLDGASHVQAQGDRHEHYEADFQRTVEGRATLDYRGGRDVRVSGGETTRILGDTSALYVGARRMDVAGPSFTVFGDTVHVTASGGAAIAGGHGAQLGRAEVSEEGEIEISAPSVTVRGETALTLSVGSSRIVIQGDKIIIDAETIEIAAKKEVALTTDSASTVWADAILAKAESIRAASSGGSSLELGSKAKLDGPSIALGESASVEKRAFERRKTELPTVPKTRVNLRDLAGRSIANAAYEVSLPGYTDRGTASGGSIEVPVFDDVESCLVRWGRPLADREAGASQEPFEFQSTIFLRTDVPGNEAETARRKLRNMGHQHESLHAAKHAFARRVGIADAEDEGMLTSSIEAEHRG